MILSIANWSPKVEEEKMIKWLETAFNVWGIYSNLKFKRLFDPSADIIIAFGSGYHGDKYIYNMIEYSKKINIL